MRYDESTLHSKLNVIYNLICATYIRKHGMLLIEGFMQMNLNIHNMVCFTKSQLHNSNILFFCVGVVILKLKTPIMCSLTNLQHLKIHKKLQEHFKFAVRRKLITFCKKLMRYDDLHFSVNWMSFSMLCVQILYVNMWSYWLKVSCRWSSIFTIWSIPRFTKLYLYSNLYRYIQICWRYFSCNFKIIKYMEFIQLIYT